MRLPRLTPYVLAALACGRQLHGATAAFELESTRPLAMSLTRPAVRHVATLPWSLHAVADQP
jgi:hypothetical protein